MARVKKGINAHKRHKEVLSRQRATTEQRASSSRQQTLR